MNQGFRLKAATVLGDCPHCRAFPASTIAAQYTLKFPSLLLNVEVPVLIMDNRHICFKLGKVNLFSNPASLVDVDNTSLHTVTDYQVIGMSRLNLISHARFRNESC